MSMMSQVKDGDTIAVWFSSGAASAVAALETVLMFGSRCNVRVINNPIKEEDDDNTRFLKHIELLIGQPIEHAVNPDFPDASCVTVWDKRKFMSSPQGAPCTHQLKKKARQEWEKNNRPDWHVLGFTADEEKRHRDFTLTERENVLPILISKGLSKDDCYKYISDLGVELPRVYHLGYPNANCIGCVKATSPTYWNHVRKIHPEVFDARAAQSREIGARLVRCHPKYLSWCYQGADGKWRDGRENRKLYRVTPDGREVLESPRVFLDELPAAAKGRPMKGMDFECGIFCEEKPSD